MSKKLTFRGILDEGTEEKIRLATMNGKTGYKITKFQIISNTPGTTDKESLVKIYSKAQGSGNTTVDFTESDLLAVAYFSEAQGVSYPAYEFIIFDNTVFNQNIFVSLGSVTGTIRVNYYIELETIPLTDVQASQLTLKNLRQIASR